MNRIQTACYMLMASAFVMTGLLLVQVGSRLTPEAHAEMVIRGGGITIMTGRTRTGEESLFMLDDVSQQLLVYTADPSRKRMNRDAVLDLTKEFRTATGGSRDNNNDRRGVTPR